MKFSRSLPYRGHCILMSLLAILIAACANDSIEEPKPAPDTAVAGDGVSVIDLGAYISMRLSETSTRADDSSTPSSGDSFNDGLQSEYKLIEGSGHHYAIVYKAGADYEFSKPMAVLPLTLTGTAIYDDGHASSGGETTTWDNITLVARTIVANTSMLTASGVDVSTANRLNSLFSGNEIYFLLNFDRSQIYTGTGGISVTGTTNEQVLANITRGDYISKFRLTDYKISSGGTDYFTMASSSYVSSGKVNYGGFNLLLPTEDNGAVRNPYFESPEAAKNATYAHITAYVERLATKYTVTFATGKLDENKAFADRIKVNYYVSWSKGASGYVINSKEEDAAVEVLGYGVNCLEGTTRVMKNIDPSKNYYNGWNDAGNNRSYWAEDNHYRLIAAEAAGDGRVYGAAGYPHQFRRALERDTVRYYHSGSPIDYIDDSDVAIGLPDPEALNPGMYLEYRSFDDMYGWFRTHTDWSDHVLYSNENTYYDPGMDNGGSWVWPWEKAPFTTATNFTLLCRLRIKDVPAGTTLYRGQNNIFYSDLNELLTSKLAIFNQVMLNAGNAGINIIHAHWSSHQPFDPNEGEDHLLTKFAWERDSYLWISYDGSTANAHEVQPNELTLIAAEIAGGDGQRLIAPKLRPGDVTTDARGNRVIVPHFFIGQVKKNDAGYPVDRDGNVITDPNSTAFVLDDVPHVDASGNEHSMYTDITYDHLVALIHKLIGPIDVFTEGYMYYSQPVPHKSGTLTLKDGKDADGNVIPAASWRTLGEIGVVRNNWYNITINGVSGVGTPVDATSQPIVPVMEVKRSYINGGISIKDWHYVKQTGVPML